MAPVNWQLRPERKRIFALRSALLILGLCCLHSHTRAQQPAPRVNALTADSFARCLITPHGGLNVWPADFSCLVGLYEGQTFDGARCTIRVDADGGVNYQRGTSVVVIAPSRITTRQFSQVPGGEFRWTVFAGQVMVRVAGAMPNGQLYGHVSLDINIRNFDVRGEPECRLTRFTPHLAGGAAPAATSGPGGISIPGQQRVLDFAACPTEVVPQGWPRDFSCMVGRYEGVGALGGQSCSLTVAPNGDVTYTRGLLRIAVLAQDRVVASYEHRVNQAAGARIVRWHVHSGFGLGPHIHVRTEADGRVIVTAFTGERTFMDVATVEPDCTVLTFVPTHPQAAGMPAQSAAPGTPLLPGASFAEDIVNGTELGRLPSGWVVRRGVYLNRNNRRAFEQSFQQCVGLAQASGAVAQRQLPLTETQLQAMDEFIEHEAFDSTTGAGRLERTGPLLARVDAAMMARAARGIEPYACERVVVNNDRAETIWHRNGLIYDVRYANARPSVSVGRRGAAATSTRADRTQRRNLAGQACFQQPVMAPMGVRGGCLWEPFAGVRYRNLPIALQKYLGFGPVEVEVIATSAGLWAVGVVDRRFPWSPETLDVLPTAPGTLANPGRPPRNLDIVREDADDVSGAGPLR